MSRLGSLLLLVIPLGCALGCATADRSVQSPALAELLVDDASYYEVRFDLEGAEALWLTGDPMVLALREGEVELVAGSTQLVGEAERTPSKLGPTYQIGLVGTDPRGAPAALRLSAILEPRGDLRGSGVLDSNGHVVTVTFSARPTAPPSAGEPCTHANGTHYHLPDGVHSRSRTPCADQRTSSSSALRSHDARP